MIERISAVFRNPQRMFSVSNSADTVYGCQHTHLMLDESGENFCGNCACLYWNTWRRNSLQANNWSGIVATTNACLVVLCSMVSTYTPLSSAWTVLIENKTNTICLKVSPSSSVVLCFLYLIRLQNRLIILHQFQYETCFKILWIMLSHEC